MFGRTVVSQAKWKKTTMGWGTAKEAPILTNDVPSQGLYGTPSPLRVHFFPLFFFVVFFRGATRRTLRIVEWNLKTLKRFIYLVCAVDTCGMRSVGHAGDSVRQNFCLCRAENAHSLTLLTT